METCPSCVSLRQQIAALRDEMRHSEKDWREAYPNGGTGRAAHTNFANWTRAWADQLDALLAPEAAAPTTEQA
jgi:hypothetical protein